MRKAPSIEVVAAGQTALELWRKERAAAKAKGPKAFAVWTADQELKKALKKTTPMQAIKSFCINCVETRQAITNCTAPKCPLYIYRPYQKGEVD